MRRLGCYKVANVAAVEHVADAIAPVLRFMGFPPSTDASGDLDSMALYAGQSAGLVREIKPAAEIVHELVEGAGQIIKQRLTRFLSAYREE
jgi:NAD(P)H-dependent flavin oxidoreductase YrpB (nitropropane dioxygenase family)